MIKEGLVKIRDLAEFEPMRKENEMNMKKSTIKLLFGSFCKLPSGSSLSCTYYKISILLNVNLPPRNLSTKRK